MLQIGQKSDNQTDKSRSDNTKYWNLALPIFSAERNSCGSLYSEPGRILSGQRQVCDKHAATFAEKEPLHLNPPE